MKRVVIVGVGFAGLEAARGLAGSGLEVLLLDGQDHHLFQPLLYQVATAAMAPAAIAPLAADIVKNWKGVSFRKTWVAGADLDQRLVQTSEGPIPYDYLVLTAGAVRNFFGLDEVQKQAFDLKKLKEAITLRDQILGVLKRAQGVADPAARAGLLTFVVVGGGPTGVELCGALAELVRKAVPREFPGLRKDRIRIVMLEALGCLLPGFPAVLSRYATRRLRRLGVEVCFGTVVVGARPGALLLKDGSTLSCHTFIWATGVQAAPLAETLPFEKGRGGRIPVLPDLSVPGRPDYYVIGDMAYVEQDGKALPMMAPVAVQEGEYVARAILARERRQSLPPFRFRDMGMMATIGRYHAVASFGGFCFSGLSGWLVWLVLHLAYLIRFRGRLPTLWEWGRDYLNFESKVRQIRKQVESGPGTPRNGGS
jgi:NADH:ubiquinone reductase (H+-translocating)